MSVTIKIDKHTTEITTDKILKCQYEIDNVQTELYHIYDIIKELKDCKEIHIYTKNLYIKNVIHEWIHLWEKDNFKFDLVKETFTEGELYRKKHETKVAGYRPNHEILRRIKSLIRDIKVTAELF